MESIDATSYTPKDLIQLAISLISHACLRDKDAAANNIIRANWKLVRLVLNGVRLAVVLLHELILAWLTTNIIELG